MPVVVGIYDTQSEAERAYVRLREHGIAEDNLALISGATFERAPQTAAELAARQQAGVTPTHDVAVPHPVDPDADRVPDHAPSAGVTPPMESDDPKLDNAALGGAIGVLVGAGMAGPLGAIVGAAAGAGIGGLLAGRGSTREEIQSYEQALNQGRFLVAVEMDEIAPEVRGILDASDPERVEVR
jgi:hypothetical protein